MAPDKPDPQPTGDNFEGFKAPPGKEGKIFSRPGGNPLKNVKENAFTEVHDRNVLASEVGSGIEWQMRADEDPEYVLTYAESFIKASFAKDVLTLAAKKDPLAALYHANLFANQPYAEKILTEAASQQPDQALQYAGNYLKEPYGKKVLKVAVYALLEKTPRLLFIHINRFKTEPYAEEVLLKAVDGGGGSESAISACEDYIDQPYGMKLLKKAVDSSPKNAIQLLPRVKKPIIEDVLVYIAQTYPDVVTSNWNFFKTKPYANKLMRIAQENERK